MNIQAYFTIIFYLLMLPIVFNVLIALRLEELFKKGIKPFQIRLLYLILTVSFSKLILDYFITIFSLISQVFD